MTEAVAIAQVELVGGAVATIERHAEVASTNALMRERFVEGRERFAPYSAIATGSQPDGRGRLEREWVAPPGQSLALSVYVELDAAIARDALGWVSLAAGLAVTDALAGLADDAPSRVRVKWPNDVLVDGRKVCGVLGELLGVVDGGRAFACVVGIGVNTAMPADSLPTPTSTSLQVAGLIGVGPRDDEWSPGSDALAAAIVRALAVRLDRLVERGGDAKASGLRDELLRCCSTIGERVRVSLPDGGTLEGTATGIGDGGELEVRLASGEVRRLQVGDVEHVRAASGEWR